MRGGAVLLEPLAVQLLYCAAQLPPQCSPKPADGLPVPLCVNRYGGPSAVLEPERADHAPAADRTKRSALGAVQRDFSDDIRQVS